LLRTMIACCACFETKHRMLLWSTVTVTEIQKKPKQILHRRFLFDSKIRTSHPNVSETGWNRTL